MKNLNLVVILVITSLSLGFNLKALAINDNIDKYELKLEFDELLNQKKSLVNNKVELSKQLNLAQKSASPQKINALFKQLDNTLMELRQVDDELNQLGQSLN